MLAARQHGVVSRRQLRRMGIAASDIDYRVKVGRLHVLYRGVYAVGHTSISPDGRRLAAVLACGADARLSHRDGAALYGIRQCNRSVYEVTVPRRPHRRRGIQLHVATLPRDEVTVVREIPVTTVPRTLLDLAAVVRRAEVEATLHEAEVRRLWDTLSLTNLIERHPRHRGARTIAAILADLAAGLEITQERMVSVFIDLVDGAGLPRPELSRHVLGHECDCVWPRAKLMVELDGYAVHGTRRNFESDRARDRALQANRWLVVRVTWRQLREDPDGLVQDLRTILAGRFRSP